MRYREPGAGWLLKWMRSGAAALMLWGAVSGTSLAQNNPGLPPSDSAPRVVITASADLSLTSARLDRLVASELSLLGLALEPRADESTLLKRLYLDTAGRLPTPSEQYRFAAADPEKKWQELVGELLFDPGYADLMALRWGDILRVKSEYPSNLWPNAVQAYHRWLHDAFASGMPMDRFARDLLLSSGSNVRNPEVNFYRAMPRRDASAAAQAAALAFMGRRYALMNEGERLDLDRFFVSLRWKRTLEWKEEIVYAEPLPVQLADLSGKQTPDGWLYPDGRKVKDILPGDARILFADWLLAPDNPVFPRVVVNRMWAWLMGRGILEPLEDPPGGYLRSASPLLDLLASGFVASGYDLRHLATVILLSDTYAQRSGVREPVHARYEVRRLDAEILADQLLIVGPLKPGYVSPIPEPFTFIPASSPTVSLADGSITSPFLVKFGRPPRDTGLSSERNRSVNRDQVLYLLNSSELRLRISSGALLSALTDLDAQASGDGQSRPDGSGREKALELAYRSLLCRSPTVTEKQTVMTWLKSRQGNRRQAWSDILWALVNSSEFLFRF